MKLPDDRNMPFEVVAARLAAGLPVVCDHNVLKAAERYLLAEDRMERAPS